MTNPYDPPAAEASPWTAPPAGTAVAPVWTPAPAPGHVVPTEALASPWARLAAALLNGVLLVVTLGIGYLVWCLVLWDQGTNPGKKMLGLTVVKADTGRVCTFGDMLLRNLVLGSLVVGLLSSVTFGIVGLVDALMILGDRRQRLTDRMAGTLVVQR